MLLDAVSKNGNLLLNVPMKADGTMDASAVKTVEAIGEWMAIHGEGIYETRPWEVYGEGVFIDTAGHNLESKMHSYTQKDFRFTKKDQTLYAFCLVNPSDDLLITSLASGARNKPHQIASVKLLGSGEQLSWKQTKDGLAIERPSKLPTPYSICFEITFQNDTSNNLRIMN
jgi:alpha-L-fucosidase